MRINIDEIDMLKSIGVFFLVMMVIAIGIMPEDDVSITKNDSVMSASPMELMHAGQAAKMLALSQIYELKKEDREKLLFASLQRYVGASYDTEASVEVLDVGKILIFNEKTKNISKVCEQLQIAYNNSINQHLVAAKDIRELIRQQCQNK